MHPDQPVYNKPARPAARSQAPIDPWLPPLDDTFRFLARDGRTFARIPALTPGAYLSLPIRSDAFRDWYFARLNGTIGKLPTAATWSAICQHLEADAARDPLHNGVTVSRRTASRDDGAVIIDLANPQGEFVEITPEGHHLKQADIDLPFEISSTTEPLPAPSRTDDRSSSSVPSASPLDLLRSSLNLGPANSPDWLRCLTWLLTSLHPSGPYPILVLRGPSGSGKSLAGRLLRSMVDPCAAPFAAMPRSATQLLHLARHNWVLAFDHVSHITPSISDALCRITSGAGLSWREPGRRDPVQQWIKRPILLTITDTCELPPDVAARALFVTLPDLTTETRRPESDVLAVINQAFPHIFDALCAAISRALANLRPVPSASRHAGALAWITAAFPDLAADLAAAIEEPPPPPLFVAQIRALPPHWEGTATDLLPLTRAAQTPKGISQALNKHALALSDAGIRISFRRRHEGQRIISIDASPCLPPPPLPTPNASHPDPQPLTPDPCSVVLCHPSLELVPLK